MKKLFDLAVVKDSSKDPLNFDWKESAKSLVKGGVLLAITLPLIGAVSELLE